MKGYVMSKKIATYIGTFFGLGLSPKAPGTVGSLGTIPLAFILAYFTGIYGIIIAAIISFVAGVLAIDVMTRDNDEKDPGKIVIDEVAGQLLTFIFVADNLYHSFDNWWIYLIGFCAFRFFDICKLGPVKWFDKNVKNAYGVMMDDVCAGLIASACIWAVLKFIAII